MQTDGETPEAEGKEKQIGRENGISHTENRKQIGYSSKISHARENGKQIGHDGEIFYAELNEKQVTEMRK